MEQPPPGTLLVAMAQGKELGCIVYQLLNAPAQSWHTSLLVTAHWLEVVMWPIQLSWEDEERNPLCQEDEKQKYSEQP